MFSYANVFIDTLQATKSNALKSIIADSKARQPLQDFIDAQTVFVKEVNRIADTIYAQVTEQVEKFTGKKA